MKRIYLLSILFTIILVGTCISGTYAQDTIVQWTFPTESGIADGASIPSNLTQVIETAGGTSDIQFKNGVTTKAAQASEWENGADEKKWKVEFETTGYNNIKLSSMISSGGQKPGPRDFKIQYKTDGSWIDVDESNFQTANDWTTGVLVDLAIPNACDNNTLVKIRWIMTSDIASDGSIIIADGISKIDDIYITGDIIDGDDEISIDNSNKIFPNPAIDFINIATSHESNVSMFDITGKEVLSVNINGLKKLDISSLKSGVYIVRVMGIKSEVVRTERIIKN
jgi:type IX secretion system substrate protein